MSAQTSFVTLRNNANLCLLAWKWHSRYVFVFVLFCFFLIKKCVTDIKAITKKREKNAYPF